MPQSIEFFRTMYDYDAWANRKAWECAGQLAEEQFNEVKDYSQGSLKMQFAHVMGAQHVWFSRLRGVSPKSMPLPEPSATRQDIRTYWDSVEENIQGWLATATDSILDSMLSYSRTGGEPQQSPIWVVLTQVLNHGTDHRAQILSQIHAFGGPTFEQDFIRFSRERGLPTGS